MTLDNFKIFVAWNQLKSMITPLNPYILKKTLK
jgi:hypothetical protein